MLLSLLFGALKRVRHPSMLAHKLRHTLSRAQVIHMHHLHHRKRPEGVLAPARSLPTRYTGPSTQVATATTAKREMWKVFQNTGQEPPTSRNTRGPTQLHRWTWRDQLWPALSRDTRPHPAVIGLVGCASPASTPLLRLGSPAERNDREFPII